MAYSSLRDVAGDKAGELLDACRRYRRALPKLSGAAGVEELRTLLDKRADAIEPHCAPLGALADELDSSSGAHSAIMEAMITEARRVCALEGSHAARDAALVGIAQRIEHDLFAATRQLQRYARELKLKGFDKRLTEMMREARLVDRELDSIAHGTLFGPGIDRTAAEEVRP